MAARLLSVALFTAAFTFSIQAEIVHLVASSGQAGEMKKLLSKDSSLANARDSAGMTPLMHAAAGGNVPVVRLLLESGAQSALVDTLDRDALDCAIFGGAYDAARALVDKGVTVDREYTNGQTRLTLAAARGDLAATHFLLMNGADPKKANKDGLLPLDAAKKSGFAAIIELTGGFVPPEKPAVPVSSLSKADSARLYAVSEFTDADSMFEAIRQGRRSFKKCTLKQLDLAGMNLALLDFEDADMSGCDLRNAILVGANLKGTVLKNAYLRKADLRRATVKKANFSDAYLTHADLSSAVGVDLDMLKRTRNLFGTKLEKDLDEQVRQYLKGHQKDPGNDWVGNPWFAESKIKAGDTTLPAE